MSLIVAIEPDRRQAEVLASLAKGSLQAELIVADSARAALKALAERIPDLILTSLLLSPKDESALADRLRKLDAAGVRVQTLVIPVFATTPRRARSRGGLLTRLRGKQKDQDDLPEGCDPAVFSAQVHEYLAHLEAERHAAAVAREDEELARTEATAGVTVEEPSPASPGFDVESEWYPSPTPDVSEASHIASDSELHSVEQAWAPRPDLDPALSGSSWTPEAAYAPAARDGAPDVATYLAPDVEPRRVIVLPSGLTEQVLEPAATTAPTAEPASIEVAGDHTPVGDVVFIEPEQAVPVAERLLTPEVDLMAIVEELEREIAGKAETVTDSTPAAEQTIAGDPVSFDAAENVGFDLNQWLEEVGGADPTQGAQALPTQEPPITAAFEPANDQPADSVLAEFLATAPEDSQQLPEPTAPAADTDTFPGAADLEAPFVIAQEADSTFSEFLADADDSLQPLDVASWEQEVTATVTTPVVEVPEITRQADEVPATNVLKENPELLEFLSAGPMDVAEPSDSPSRDGDVAAPVAVALDDVGGTAVPAVPALAETETVLQEPPPQHPEWLDMLSAIRRDIEQLRADLPLPGAPGADSVAQASRNKKKSKRKKKVSLQGEWGFFDPEKVGFGVLVDKLNEIAGNQP